MDKLAEALQTAMNMERRGREAYIEAADRIKQPVVASILVDLANDESEHELMISRYYAALQRHQGWPAPDREDRPMDLPERVKNALDMTVEDTGSVSAYIDVYEHAAVLERASRDFYIAQADDADDRRLVEFFGFLARVEQTHLSAMERLITGGAKGS
jgi:rubrerythrin